MPIANERQAKQRVISIIKQLKKNLSLSEPPQYTFPDEPVATHLGIKVQEGLLPSGHDGLYHPDPPRIIINRSGSQERDNFTYFHEITHHLVRQDNELYSFLHEYCPTEADFTRTLDTYCNIGAAEFIIPSSDVQDMIRANGFGIELLSQLDEQYPASKPAIAFQLAGCALHKCVIVVCDYGQVPKREHQQHQLIASDSKDQPALFVRYYYSPKSHHL
jgi:Zn-dependent peptidase ImmA (M78 family)